MDTLPKLLNYQAQTFGNRVALRTKDLGLWKSLTWRETLNEVQRFACGLAALGVVRGDTVAVIGDNSPRIFCTITACQSIGAIAVPIYDNLAGDELVKMLEKTAPRYVVAKDQQQVDVMLEMQSRGFPLEAVIYTVGRGMSGYDHKLVHDFEVIQERGDEYARSNSGFYAESMSVGGGDDPAMILFNSGVDEEPKPVVMWHRHIISVANYVADVEHVTEEDEILSFMPIFLPANLLCGYALSYVTGMCLSCPENSETVMENLREIGPSLLYAPPHVYKQIHASIRERIGLTRGLSRKLYDRYMGRAEQKKHSRLGDILVMTPVRELYGLNYLRSAFTSGDAISTDVFRFFDALRVGLKQIYGTAETFGCITIQVEEQTEENVGRAIRGMEIKIADDGEIVCRGDNVFPGYYKDEQATAAVLDQDGWFHTGDIGTLSGNGELTVLDKMMALGKLRDGTAFMPKAIEKAIKESLYISEAFVSGDGEESLVAVVTIDRGTVSTWAEQRDIRYTSYADLALKPEVVELIRKQVAEANRRVAGGQPAVKSFVIFHRQLSPQTGELTWTHKMRRKVMGEHFAGLLRALYDGRSEFEFDDPRSGSRINFQLPSL